MIRRWQIIAVFSLCFLSSLLLYFHTETLQDFDKSSSSIYLVINIISKPDNNFLRQTLRDTWLRLIEDKFSVKYFFTIGILSVNNSQRILLEKENNINRDILFLPVADSYNGLTSKVLNSLSVINQDYNFEYLLKCDDDTFVNLPQLIAALHKLEHPSLYWGYFHGQAHVFSKGPWKESKWNLCDRYLPYALGGGYVLSKKLVSFLSENAAILRKFKSEDVSVGTWLSGVKTKRIHDLRFDTQAKTRGCQNNFLLKHKQSPKDMIYLYRSLVNSKVLCPVVQQTSLKPYSYNWNALPSKCCSYVDGSDPKVPMIYVSDFQ